MEQWSVVAPHQPPEEQQAPKVEPRQVFLPLPPQAPSSLMLLGGPHVPKRGWHVLPQWAVVFPQKPLAEQQSPNTDPVQLNWLLPPQLPSGDILPGPGGFTGGALQFPADGWLG